MMKSKLLIALLLVTVLLLSATRAYAALPTALAWTKSTSNPVITSSKCYSGDHFDPSVVIESPGVYKMYVSAHDSSSGIYVLESNDGGLTWTCGNGGSPVLDPAGAGAWDSYAIYSVSVIKDGDIYKMWYTGQNAARASGGVYGIGYAVSNNGESFSRSIYTPVLTAGSTGAWDSSIIREPTVLKIGSTYHMWYAGTAKWPFFRIGHATSPNGVTWIKDVGNPVVSPVAGSWDANETYAPSVVANGSDYEMFFSGNSGGRWVTGHATASSANGPWTQDSNALLSPDNFGWETGADSLDYAEGVLDAGVWKIFYSAGGTYQIGLATLMNEAQLTFNPLTAPLTVGGSKTISIDLNAVTNIYGYQFEVDYDASKLNATGSLVNTFFDTTTNAFVAENGSCTAGVCKFAVSKVDPGTAVSGSGTLAQITFTGTQAGEVPITISNDILSDKNVNQIVHTKTTAFITVYRTVNVTGTVNMQGRSATPPSDGTGTVTIYDEFGYAPTATATFPAAGGAWSATVMVDPNSSAFDIEASHSLYLTNRLTGADLSGASYNAAPTLLLGGDANNDSKVDIGDLSCIGGNFGNPGVLCGTTGNTDINADGITNILDLVMGGGNYGLSSPRAW